MPFPRLYDDLTCPLVGYEGYSFRVLLNPTGQEKTDWARGHLGVEGCAECALERPGTYCADCSAARDRMGRAAVAIYGTSHTEGFDFSTPESSLATFAMDDLPDELLAWLYTLPINLWAARSESLKKTFTPLSTSRS